MSLSTRFLTFPARLRIYICTLKIKGTMMKVNLKKTPTFGFILALIFLVHLPIVFASPKSAKENLFYTAKSNDVKNFNTSKENIVLYNVYDSLQLQEKGLSRKVFEYAVRGFNKIKAAGAIENDKILSIVDFSRPSSEKRLFIIDVKNFKLLFNTYVAHGMRSGKAFANTFSNALESNKSSLGFYKTADTYMGKNGYSLHLVGLEKGFNDNAYRRDIVIHAADYVNENMIRMKGWIGRSWGCPAIPEYLSRPIIDNIKDGTCLFIFGTDKKYLLRSAMIGKGVHDLALN
jgi:hypothetical protein